MTKSFDFGIARITVNGKPAADSVDLFSPEPRVERLPLGRFEPVNNAFVIRLELTGPNPKSRGARTYMGLDYVLVAAP